jgi:hypothetical protein
VRGDADRPGKRAEVNFLSPRLFFAGFYKNCIFKAVMDYFNVLRIE